MHKSFRTAIMAAGATMALTLIPSAAMAEDGFYTDDRGLHLGLLDGDVDLRVGGKLQLDALTVDDDGTSYTDADVRRARVDVRLVYRDVITLRAERDFAGTKGWRNLYVSVRPMDGALVQAGQFNVPFSLEDMQSSNTIPFPERSLAAALTSELALGVQAGYASRRFTVRAGYFEDQLDTPAGPSPTLGDGFTGRATVLAIDRGRTKLHLGIGLDRRSFDVADVVRYSADAGSTFGPRVLRTPVLTGLSRRTGYNAEAAFTLRNLAVQGQYIRQDLQPATGTAVQINGGYAQASWVVTGQPYDYSRGSGTITGPDLDKRKVAVELAMRASWLDAQDGAFDGGKARSFDLSAGLYFRRNVRLMASGSLARYHRNLADPARDATIALTRLQIAF